MRLSFVFVLAASLLATVATGSASDSRHGAALRAVASADSTEVHPENVFDVTLSLVNLTDTVQKIKVPECGWDRVWRSSNHHVSWDAWDCDDNTEVTIEIPPRQSYVFPKVLKMFVDEAGKKSRVDFRMGFKTAAFGKVLWSDPITLEVTP